MDPNELDPIEGNGARAPRKAKKAKQRAKAAAFDEGDEVLISKPHLHGIHATVQNVRGDNVIVRVNEHQHEGFLLQFSADDLEPARKGDLDKHPNERLDWDRYEKAKK